MSVHTGADERNDDRLAGELPSTAQLCDHHDQNVHEADQKDGGRRARSDHVVDQKGGARRARNDLHANNEMARCRVCEDRELDVGLYSGAHRDLVVRHDSNGLILMDEDGVLRNHLLGDGSSSDHRARRLRGVERIHRVVLYDAQLQALRCFDSGN